MVMYIAVDGLQALQARKGVGCRPGRTWVLALGIVAGG